MSEFDHALTQVPPALREDVARYWQDFLIRVEQAGLSFPSDLEILNQLTRVWACSDFVARSCVQAPGMLADLLTSGDLVTSYTPEDYPNRLNRYLVEVGDEAQLGVVLRRFRRREMVRIAWRDLAGLAKLEEILADLSHLADACIDLALNRLCAWQTERFGTPRNAAGEPQQLIVLGLGKLGGRELNFSSDIDLIFAYPERGETDGPRSISNEEFFRRLGQKLIKILNEPTSEGFVYRVDMRLRPFGDSGPLVMSFAALESYYQDQGREWERYALIKARVVAGDRDAGERLLTALRPFVYRRYLDYGAFESLRSMKAMIAKEVERKGLQRNIKLGPGGIREIEFIGQAFQLIYGGREPALRERSILRVLDCLAQSERLPPYAVQGLERAYVFLRRTENRLQAWADQQTHNLPREDLAKLRLAYAMDFPDWETYVRKLLEHAQLVSDQFEQVFATPQTEAGSSLEALDFAAVWQGTAGHAEAIDFLVRQGFDDSAAALKSLHGLKESFSYRAMSQRGRERLDNLMPMLLAAVANTAHPTITLDRIIRLLEAVARRSVYLALLVENPLALSQLVKLCAASVWIAEYLARYPLLLDELLDPGTLYAPLSRRQLQEELDRYLERVPAADTEQVLDTLRHFKHTNTLRVAAAEVSGAMPLMVVSDHLTEIAEVLLRKILELAWADLIPRYGRPRCVVNGEIQESDFAIVAYGKLGGIELGYGSDLDLVFLHDGRGEDQQTSGPREIDNATFFFRLAQRVIHMLTARTAAGLLYEVDTRLRPSGRSGLLVSSLVAFAEYQRNQAWTWEHQALVRARVVAGPMYLVERFAAIRSEILSRERDPIALRREVKEMRERMRKELSTSKPGVFDIKQDRGGIADIEFMVQYAVLAGAYQHPELLTYTDNIRQLEGLEQTGILTKDDAVSLRDAYRALRRKIHLLKLQERPSLIPEQELRDYREAVIRIWKKLLGSNSE